MAMNELIVLSAGIFVLLIYSALMSQYDFFSPSLIVCILFFVSSLLAIRDVIAWDVSDDIFSSYGTIVLLSGIAVFVMTEQIVTLFLRRKGYGKKSQAPEEITPLKVSKVKLLLLLIIVVISAFIYCFMTYRIAVRNGYKGNFSLSAVAAFRHDISFDSRRIYETPRWVRIIKNVIDINIYIGLYLFIRNVVYAKDKIRHNIIYLALIAPSIPANMINSARGTFLQAAGSGVFFIYIMLRRREGWKSSKKVFMKIAKKSCVILVVALILFYLIQANGFFGRTTDRSFLDHVTMYVGAPIIHFYQFIQSPPADVLYFGQETFVSLNRLLLKLGLVPEAGSAQLELRGISGHYGNIYTFFRRPLHDFGLIGMYFITALTSFAFSYFYYKKIYKRSEFYCKDTTVILYGYFFYIVYLFPMLCELCNLVYFGIIYLVLIILILYGWITDGKIFRIKLP